MPSRRQPTDATHFPKTCSGPRPLLGRGPSSLKAEIASLLRGVERKRRLFRRVFRSRPVPAEYLVRVTCSSFRLEDLAVTEQDVAAALAPTAGRRALRPPRVLRIRNHLAILRHVEKLARDNTPLEPGDVVRWYTSIGCGLSIAGMDLSRVNRLDQHLRRINSSQSRLLQALREVAALHVQLLADPLFPGFNGLLVRLLLQYHLSRCGLPPVRLDPEIDGTTTLSESTFLPRLARLVVEAYDTLCAAKSYP